MSCYGCACDHCVCNAEITIWDLTPGELRDGEEICFFCDECKNYDGDYKKRSQWREKCSRQRLAEKYLQRKREADARAAERLAMECRKSFRVIPGGGNDTMQTPGPKEGFKLI